MKNKLSNFLMIFLLWSLNLSAQNWLVIDSLKNEVRKKEMGEMEISGKTTKLADSSLVNLILTLGREYMGKNVDSFMYYSRHAFSIANQINYKKGSADAITCIGVAAWYNGNYAEALECQEKALKWHQELRNKKGIGNVYNNIGLIYKGRGNNILALKYYLLALQIWEETGNKFGICHTSNNIGGIYVDQDNYAEALKQFNHALNVAMDIGDSVRMAVSFVNIGIVYENQNRFTESLDNYKKGLAIYEIEGEKNYEANVYNSIGSVYLKLRQPELAIYNQRKALEIRSLIADKFGLISSYQTMARTYDVLENKKMALDYAGKAMVLSGQYGMANELRDSYRILSELHASQKDFKEAYDLAVLYYKVSDSLFNSETSTRINDLALQFQYDKKHLEDSIQQAHEKQNTELKLQRQQVYSTGGYIGIAMVCLLLFFVYRNYTNQRKANRILTETQNQLIESEKMAVFGTLATRVAHEIQNPLNFVGNFSLLSEELLEEILTSKNEKDKIEAFRILEENLKKIVLHSGRADKIIKDLLEHTKAGTVHNYFNEDPHKVL